jgi:chromatin remodeling complex protein RSC6
MEYELSVKTIEISPSEDEIQKDTKVSKKYDQYTDLKFINTLSTLKLQMNDQSKVLKEMKDNIKKLESVYYSDINKVIKHKKKRSGTHKATGFIKKSPLPKEMALLIGVDEGAEYSTPEYTKEIYRVLNNRNLLYKTDNRVFRVDDELKKVFNLTDKVNTSINYKDKDGFNFTTIQSHLSKAFMKYRSTNENTICTK